MSGRPGRGKNATSWKKGQCGNPRKINNGRKPGNMVRLREMLYSNEDFGTLCHEQLVALIMQGDLGAIKEGLARAFGREPLRVDVAGVSLDPAAMATTAKEHLAGRAVRELELAERAERDEPPAKDRKAPLPPAAGKPRRRRRKG